MVAIGTGESRTWVAHEAAEKDEHFLVLRKLDVHIAYSRPFLFSLPKTFRVSFPYLQDTNIVRMPGQQAQV